MDADKSPQRKECGVVRRQRDSEERLGKEEIVEVTRHFDQVLSMKCHAPSRRCLGLKPSSLTGDGLLQNR